MPLDERSSHLRDAVLAPSGGWLGEIVIILADLTGAWDILILMVVFVASWIVMRTTSCEISAIIGLIFDLGIPVQYQNEDRSEAKHKRHLEKYWPTLIIASIGEAAGYLFFHPNLFTLVVCMKTNVCVVLWLSKTPSGSSIVGPNTSNDHSRPSNATSSRPTRDSSTSSGSTSRPRDPERDRRETSSRYPFPVDPRFPQANDDLKRANYDDPLAREGFIYHLLGEPDHRRARSNLRNWLSYVNKPTKRKERMEKYRERALKERRKIDEKRGESGASRRNEERPRSNVRGDESSRSSSSSHTSRGDRDRKDRKTAKERPMTLPDEEIKQIDNHLKKLDSSYWKNPKNRSAYIQELQTAKSPEELRDKLKDANFVSQSWKSHHLDGQFSPEQLQERRTMLVDNDYGMGLPQDIADLMIDDMLNQKTVKEADALFKAWRNINLIQRGKHRTSEVIKLMKKYERYIGEALPAKSTRVGWAS